MLNKFSLQTEIANIRTINYVNLQHTNYPYTNCIHIRIVAWIQLIKEVYNLKADLAFITNSSSYNKENHNREGGLNTRS